MDTFPEDPYTAVEVAWHESEYVMTQSNHRYEKDRPDWGVRAGDRERSFCIFQIHEPAHKETIQRLGLEDFKTNVESCVKMARVVYDQRGGSFKPWSVYKDILAMR